MSEKKEKKIVNFMSARWIATALSVVLLLASIGSLATKGISFGLDFTGGTQIEVAFEQPLPLTTIRDELSTAGYDGAIVVHFGSERDVLVRLPKGYADTVGAEMVELLVEKSGQPVELRRIEFVGPQVGEELREQGGLAMLLALAVVMLYVAIRFQFKFSVGAVVALAHDVIIILGIFSFFQLDFDLTVLAALLAVIGYSLNDTIVVSDRIRENFRKLRVSDPVKVINISLTETLGRTVITSLTTALVLTALFVFGGEMIHSFALALLIGVGVGTYSSIYVAANAMIMMGISREDLIPQVSDDEELDARP
ncbi:MAG: protein translocase subunit SecF [Pseudomonadales bacterium]